ncbi:MAG TPA: hypothetical protein VN777_14750 [Terriglobales bacterium]|jgi:hypothetical protein|nr:hypothetical protein [Terriglobales bacterium]
MNGPLKVGDFPVGTLESRAVARVVLGQRRSKLTRLQFFHSIRGPWRGDGPEPPDVPKANPWIEGDDGKLFRVVYVPHVWVAREEAVPSCPECRTPYRKATDYPNYPFVGYRADCVDKHIQVFSTS